MDNEFVISVDMGVETGPHKVIKSEEYEIESQYVQDLLLQNSKGNYVGLLLQYNKGEDVPLMVNIYEPEEE